MDTTSTKNIRRARTENREPPTHAAATPPAFSHIGHTRSLPIKCGPKRSLQTASPRQFTHWIVQIYRHSRYYKIYIYRNKQLATRGSYKSTQNRHITIIVKAVDNFDTINCWFLYWICLRCVDVACRSFAYWFYMQKVSRRAVWDFVMLRTEGTTWK